MSEFLTPDADINRLLTTLMSGAESSLSQLDKLLSNYPDDARLHFMRGSLLIGDSRLVEAHRSMRTAVELAPEFAIARYQLGFFELTSGEVEQALSTWRPLLARAEDDYLRVFVEGMVYLINDDFSQSMATLEQGISLNHENEPLNDDARLILDKITGIVNQQATSSTSEQDEFSTTSLILGQFGGSRTVN